MFLTTDDGNIGDSVTQALEDGWRTWTGFGLALAIAIGVALAVMVVVSIALSLIGRRGRWAAELHARTRWPFRVTLIVIALLIASIALPVGQSLRDGVHHTLGIVLIASAAWLLTRVFLFFVDSGTKRYQRHGVDSFSSRKMRTQLQIIRRLVVAVIVIFAVGAILMTFESVRAVGASVLASAGVASIVAGLAAQSILGNLFAGVQLAFSEAIRVGDVVVVQGEYGKIREITLSYVVLEVWDQRTLVLPCTYFTTTPFENWTKLGRALMGTVFFDLDWRVDVDALRDEVDRLLAETDLWDGVGSGVVVTDASGGMLQVRVMVSAADADKLWSLRCLVREQLASWVRREHPDALPLQRVRMDEPTDGERDSAEAMNARDLTGPGAALPARSYG